MLPTVQVQLQIAATVSFSIVVLGTRGAIRRMIVKRATLLNEPCTESATLPQKWVKGDLHVFHQNVGDYPYLKRIFSRF